ncbi:MAG TPA: potassium-transporting ATPase subunit B, partial [Thermoanaerobaculia bacterium]|nr:potassium-transporting ATPase subunit B [Thermoanaerobaculia bacterium]
MAQPAKKRPLFDPPIVRRALADSFRKLDPRQVARNPVMFVVEVGSVLTTLLIVRDVLFTSGAGAAAGRAAHLGFTIQVTLWLWFTVLFANFAEAMAEGRGKAQADTLRRTKTETVARRIPGDWAGVPVERLRTEEVPAPALRRGDVVLIVAGEL